jgi:hypothetical protein
MWHMGIVELEERVLFEFSPNSNCLLELLLKYFVYLYGPQVASRAGEAGVIGKKA